MLVVDIDGSSYWSGSLLFNQKNSKSCMIKDCLYNIAFTTIRALGKAAAAPERRENFQWRFPYASPYFFLRIFFKDSTTPNCRLTCAPTPKSGINIPL